MNNLIKLSAVLYITNTLSAMSPAIEISKLPQNASRPSQQSLAHLFLDQLYDFETEKLSDAINYHENNKVHNLLDSGVDPNKLFFGKPPVITAVLACNTTAFKMLLSHKKIDIARQDACGETATSLAEKLHDVTSLTILKKHRKETELRTLRAKL